MPRLVTFGCSLTYGYALKDCYPVTDKPSELAWPTLLAKKLNRDCLNLSVPGSGNLQILMAVLKTEYQPDDLIIVAHSYFNRFEWFKFDDYQGNGYTVTPSKEGHKQKILSELGEKHIEEKYYWYNWLAIHHTNLFLQNQNVKFNQFLNIPKNKRDRKFNMLPIPNFWEDVRVIIEDVALDTLHPGPLSNELQAQILYEKINGQT